MNAARRRRPRAASTAAAADASAASAAPHFAARLVPLDPGLYAFSLDMGAGWREPAVGFPVPAVHVCAAPHCEGAVTVIDGSGRAGSWLGGRERMLVVKAPVGGAALVTAYLARDPDSPALEVEIRRVDPPAPPVTLKIGGSAVTDGRVSLEIVAHIRGRGDVRYVDAPWIGRLGRGLWIEALTIQPRDPAAAAAIEYKGLNASGAETPWLGSGSPCGTRGRSVPLIGFAVRQKTGPGGTLFDCEYSGYFQSGATAGPVRNGAPCRSPINNDPLEGMQLRITPRPSRAASANTK